jgi:hypothetical protein
VTEPRNGIAPLPLGAAAGSFKVAGTYAIRSFSYLYVADGPDGRIVLEEFVPHSLVSRSWRGELQPRPGSEALYSVKLNRFRKATLAMEAVRHRNVLPILGSFAANGTSFRVYPWSARRTLAGYLDALPGRAVDQGGLWGVILPLLEALEAGHSKGLVHHALSPYCVWMTETGELLLAFLGDVFQEYREGYSAPELLSPAPGAFGPWTDLYSLGATAFRALTGETPASASLRLEAALSGCRDPLEFRLGAFRATLPQPLFTALSRALKMDPGERVRDAGELRELLEGRPPRKDTAAPPSPAPGAGPYAAPAPAPGAGTFAATVPKLGAGPYAAPTSDPGAGPYAAPDPVTLPAPADDNGAPVPAGSPPEPPFAGPSAAPAGSSPEPPFAMPYTATADPFTVPAPAEAAAVAAAPAVETSARAARGILEPSALPGGAPADGGAGGAPPVRIAPEGEGKAG